MKTEAIQKKKIFVGLSGGVDSSVSAALLKEVGHEVTGVYIKPWQPDWTPCTWRDEREDAMRVAVQLEIPFHTLNLSEEYKKEVAEYMIREYEIGRTPNPDIMCNRAIKFGAFWEWAREQGADAIATGHYARVAVATREARNSKSENRNKDEKQKTKKEDKTKTYKLLAGVDANKDQSYFLWTLTQADLAHVFFPVGGYEKGEVRKIAERFDLPTAEKKDSQGICFLGDIDMKEFLGHYIETKEGDVLNSDGEIIGTHTGALLYTLGERRGFTITQKTPHMQPLYVIGKDVEKNTIIVAEKYADGSLPSAVCEVILENTNWIEQEPEQGTTYTARIRYRQALQKCTVTTNRDTTALVHFESPQSSVASGQSVVVYKDDVCVGGGVVV